MCNIYSYFQEKKKLKTNTWLINTGSVRFFFSSLATSAWFQRLNKSFSKQLAVCLILFYIYGSHHFPPEVDLTVLVPMMKWAFITERKKNGVNKELKINQETQKNIKSKISFAVPQAFSKTFGVLISQVSISLFVFFFFTHSHHRDVLAPLN